MKKPRSLSARGTCSSFPGIDEEIFDRVTAQSGRRNVFDPEKAYYVEWQIHGCAPLGAEDERTRRQSWSM